MKTEIKQHYTYIRIHGFWESYCTRFCVLLTTYYLTTYHLLLIVALVVKILKNYYRLKNLKILTTLVGLKGNNNEDTGLGLIHLLAVFCLLFCDFTNGFKFFGKCYEFCEGCSSNIFFFRSILVLMELLVPLFDGQGKIL